MSLLRPTVRRVRAVAAILLVAVFVAGVEAGTAWTRVRGTSVNVQVRMSTKLPDELVRLNLSREQQDSLRRILLVGQQHLRGVLREFEPRLQAAIDSVDTEIRATLTAEQRARFDAGRRRAVSNKIEIDTVHR